ncbi:unnamed protein product [Microthlaspi erraticum]|uniref:Major facilitator superfamily (MFS) profile domain-containing protein n=1 Tax=Microthlaspi erraticum TaxID=1685480 RepID=A0A6D2HTM3_9BRAS|nr:unnamed protein product [Microthlaspi erraticum]
MEFAKTKWVAAAASIWIQSLSGASYTFGIYSSLLKSSQSYDQSTLDTVSVYKDIGANVGILSGLFYTAVASGKSGTSRRFFSGPWVVIFVGLLQWFVGYGFIWMAASGVINRPPVPVMCFFMFLAGHCQPFFNTAIVVTAVRNFSDYGGTAVGIMKGYVGLSGAILVQMYHIFCEGDPTNYILLLAVVPSLFIFMTMPFVRTYDTVVAGDKKHLNGLSAISLIIVIYLMVVILVENVFGMSETMQICSFTLLLILLASPLLVAVRAQRDEKARLLSLDLPVNHTTALLDSPRLNTSDFNVVMTNDMNVVEAICTTNFWLLFVAMICGMGSGLATINNIRQMGESLGYSTVQLNALVSLWSIWNFLGRFGSGYISDAYLHSHGWPRPVFMAITLVIMAMGHLVMASGLVGSLYVGSLLVGLAYGSQWSLMPTITSEIFGIIHMATIFYTISIASPIGSYIFSVKVIGYFYDKVDSEDDHSCYGNHCFRASFIIMGGMALLGALVAFVLFLRTKKFYATLVAKRMLK